MGRNSEHSPPVSQVPSPVKNLAAMDSDRKDAFYWRGMEQEAAIRSRASIPIALTDVILPGRSRLHLKFLNKSISNEL